ncbi:MAG: TolC family protein [Gammaproteobacteria bacterium]|nr:TolC family protein [Gammaproteobacteria bacterium]
MQLWGHPWGQPCGQRSQRHRESARTRPWRGILLGLGGSALIISLPGCQRYGLFKPEPKEPLMEQEVALALQSAPEFDYAPLLQRPAITPDEVDIDKNERNQYETARNAATIEPGEDSFELTVEDLRRYVLENNLDIKVVEVDPATAEQRLLAEKAKFEDVFTGSTTYTKSYDRVSKQADTISVSPSVQVPMRDGSSLTLSMPYTHTDSDVASALGGQVGRTDTLGLSASLSIPLFRNAGTFVNTASIRSAALALRQTDSRTRLAAIRVLANAEKAYWNYYGAFEILAIQLRQYQLAQEQLQAAVKLVEEGVRTKVEITRAESGVATRFDSVIQAETNRRRTERELKRSINLAGLPLDGQTALRPTTLPTPLGLTFERDNVVRLATLNRMELLENEIQLLIDQINIDTSRNQVLPSVSLDLSYGFSGQGSKFAKAVENLFREEYDTWSAGVTASVPLWGNEAAQARLREQVLNRSKTRLNRDALLLSIRQDVLNAIDAVEQNWQRILSNRRATERAQQTYLEEQQQFAFGEITGTDLLNALTEVSTAAINEVQSMVDYQNALVDLAFATGTTLGQSGVLWEPAKVEDQPGRQYRVKPLDAFQTRFQLPELGKQ